MSPRPPLHEDCSGVRERLRERWLAWGPGGASAVWEAAAESRGPLDEHLDSCPACRSEADELLFVDAALGRSFRLLGDRAPPDESRIEETVRRLRDGSEGADLIRKVRRPIRILLWTTFYLFTLLACLTLAVAVIRALKGNG
jgi:hypothetical protein